MAQDTGADDAATKRPSSSSQEPLSKAEERGAIAEFVSDVRVAVQGSLRANRFPALISLFVGLAMVGAYYGGGDATRPVFDALGEMRTEGGILFSIVSTCLFGGVLPSMLQVMLRTLRRPYLAHVLFDVILWSALGACVDRLYTLQSYLFGDAADAPTIVKKVCFDQFVWNPFIVTFTSAMYRWRDYGFPSPSAWRHGVLLPRGWLLTYCSFLISIWGTWIPGTCVVYLFPEELQIPAFNVILFMFSILLSIVSRSVASKDNEGVKVQMGDDGASEGQQPDTSEKLRDSAEAVSETASPERKLVFVRL